MLAKRLTGLNKILTKRWVKFVVFPLVPLSGLAVVLGMFTQVLVGNYFVFFIPLVLFLFSALITIQWSIANAAADEYKFLAYDIDVDGELLQLRVVLSKHVDDDKFKLQSAHIKD